MSTCAQLPGEIHAVAVWQSHVKQDRVWCKQFELSQRLGHGGRMPDDAISAVGEDLSGRATETLIVVDDQDRLDRRLAGSS